MRRRHDQAERIPQIDAETGRPLWAGRVSRFKIAQLYHTDARGIVDQDLIDEVGYALLARCESILIATESRRGRAMCPVCRHVIHHDCGPEDALECDECGWRISWSEYLASVRKKGLNAGGIEGFLQEFVEKYPQAPSPRHRMILIDQPIHRYHWEMVNEPGRPGGSNLIGGTVAQVAALLNGLTYSEQSTAGLREMNNRWHKQGRKMLRRLARSGALEKEAIQLSEDQA